MNFPWTLYLLAAAGGFAASLLSFPLCRKGCQRIGLVDDPGHRKIHSESVPLAGGLTVMLGMVLPVVAAVIWLTAQGPENQLDPGPTPDASGAAAVPHSAAAGTGVLRRLVHGLNRRGVELTTVLLGAAGMLGVGLLDDRHELRPAAKFAGQLLVAGVVAAGGTRITLFVPNLAFSYAITLLWILTIINACNFMDNMNGLCSGLGVIGAFCFAMIAAHAGQYLVALIAFLCCGALLGFLPYNYPRAKAFLGDGGSHLVGYLLAILAILPHYYTSRRPHVLGVASPLLVLAVPLGDLIRVVLLRWRNGKPFYVGDTNHLSHRLVRMGFSPARAVSLIWLLAALSGAAAFLLEF